MELMNVLITSQYLRQNGGNSSGGGADWNANEGEAGYIKNRTHYTEVKRIVVLPETTAFIDGPANPTPTVYNVNFVPDVREKILVVFDGVEYNLRVSELPKSFGDMGFLLGEASVSDAPFVGFFDLHGAGTVEFINKNLDGGTHTFSIYYDGEFVTKIDPKYMPEGVGCEEVKEVWTPVVQIPDASQTSESGNYVYSYICHQPDQFVVGDRYKVIVDEYEIEGVATSENVIITTDNMTLERTSNSYRYVTSYEVASRERFFMGIYHSDVQTEVHKMDSRFLPDVADLDAQWLADLKAALGI